jgi:hypothetical protein
MFGNNCKGMHTCRSQEQCKWMTSKVVGRPALRKQSSNPMSFHTFPQTQLSTLQPLWPVWEHMYRHFAAASSNRDMAWAPLSMSVLIPLGTEQSTPFAHIRGTRVNDNNCMDSVGDHFFGYCHRIHFHYFYLHWISTTNLCYTVDGSSKFLVRKLLQIIRSTRNITKETELDWPLTRIYCAWPWPCDTHWKTKNDRDTHEKAA